MPKTTNRKDHILQTALKLFAMRGYGSTTTRMIAGSAKVSLGLLYNYYKNKEDLLREIVNRGFTDIKESMKIYDSLSLSPEQAIEIHVAKTFEIIRSHSEFWRLLHTIRLQEKVAKPMKDVFTEIIKYITRVFTNVFKHLGYKSPDLEALLFLSQIDGVVLLYLQDPSTPLDKLGKQIIQRYKK